MTRAADAAGHIGGGLHHGAQIARRGQHAARAVEQFKHVRFVAQRLFGALDLVDVGVRAEPAHHVAVAVMHGFDPRQEPAEIAVGAADGKLHLERRAGAHRFVPMFEHGRQHRRVVHFLPAPARRFFGRDARVFIPALVEPDDRAVRIGHPRQLRNGVGQRAQFFFALAQVVVRRAPGADVLGHARHAQHAAAVDGAGIVGAADQGHTVRGAAGQVAACEQAAFEIEVGALREGSQHGTPHDLAVFGLQPLAQAWPRQRHVGRQAEDLGRTRTERDAVGGRIPAPVAQAPGRDRQLQAVVVVDERLLVELARRDVLEIQGQAFGGRVDPHVEPGIQAAVIEFAIDGNALLHRAHAIEGDRRAVQVFELIPQLGPDQVAAPLVERLDHLQGAAIDIGDVPVAVHRTKAVGEAFEHVFHALGGALERLLRSDQILAGHVAGSAHAGLRRWRAMRRTCCDEEFMPGLPCARSRAGCVSL